MIYDFRGQQRIMQGPQAAYYGFVSRGTGGVIPPPPANTRIIIGLTMVASGLTILYAITTNLDKGLVEDELNIITR